MKAMIQQNADGFYELFLNEIPLTTMRERKQAEAVRDVVKANLVVLTELSPRDLAEMAGFHRSQCVSEQENKRLGLAWGRNLADGWIAMPKGQLVIEYEDLDDEAAENLGA